MKLLSEKTRAEMRAGAKSVKGSEAWAVADNYEAVWRRQCRDGQQISVKPEYDGEGWFIVVELYLAGKSSGKFDPELVDSFPSEALRTQLMLVLGA